ncbi:MAG TPA: bifunctional (p)ppGpp synthetase/guanosine-3',5'-bis(diphosphate) 3'-pyrophosphohydrolase [Actinomycetota bacterium]|jgi:GTP diphosphokinase / guanosine-3',5'-bis(diphosphate) 3'-diphosphatase|nr:bifunctional (p)ppGpp synthetase/guanosine-3',5'-bis(diphosphate) 3'-pyrophosphohydrolase [Actinomycetota bacterium]
MSSPREPIAPTEGAATPPPAGPRTPGRGMKGVLKRVRPPAPTGIDRLLREFRARRPKGDAKAIERAFDMAERAHEGQMRKSGDPFISHPLGVATILATLGMDESTIAAALLHDAVEDTELSLAEVEEALGYEIAMLIDGVTKLDRIRFRSAEQSRAENLRKMIIATASDVRVLLIKLADRLHNMRTLTPLTREKQTIIARETLEIYAPLAHRLGMYAVKWELEDLAFATLHPKRFEEIDALVQQRQPERERLLEDVSERIAAKLRDVKIKAEVSGRPKHLYSIYEKLVLRGKQFDEIFDLVGIRVVVDSVRDCYAALGALHTLYTPVPGRFKDYIAMPKFNMYQSLHTTVIGPGGRPMEIQIRTNEMHRAAEFGIAAHWLYKEQKRGKVSEEEIQWLQRMMDWQRESSDPKEFLDQLRIDLYSDEIFVFTPKGDVVALPRGATSIDFAYNIHTEVGHRTVGARVNGRLVALGGELHSGDTVEIITSKAASGPSRDWLGLVKTPRARNKIRQWFARERREDALAQGRESLVTSMRKQGLPTERIQKSDILTKVAEELNHQDLESMFVAIGEGHLSPQSVTTRVIRMFEPEEEEPEADVPVPAPRRRKQPQRGKGVIVEGFDDLLVRLAKCCTPVPGDRVVGFLTRGRGVSVHREDCPNAISLAQSDDGRMIRVWWDDRQGGTFTAAIQIEALDRTKLLRDVTAAISDVGVNILTSSTRAGRDGIATLTFTFELADSSHLEHVLQAVKQVDSVFDAYRIVPSAARG